MTKKTALNILARLEAEGKGDKPKASDLREELASLDDIRGECASVAHLKEVRYSQIFIFCRM